MRRLRHSELDRSQVVANGAMNRGRGLAGVDSYERELRFDVLASLLASCQQRGAVAWLDLCCGEGHALRAAGAAPEARTPQATPELVGLDLIPSPAEPADGPRGIRFAGGSLPTWQPDRSFDLMTCVHGLHYVGDKLRALQRIASWLSDEGLFIGNIDLSDLRLQEGGSLGSALSRQLRKAGAEYSPQARVLRMPGGARPEFALEYVGADDTGGPNYTHQPVVHSYYRIVGRSDLAV